MNEPYCLFKTEKKRVVWEVTHLCNYACVHCCSQSGKVENNSELTYEQMLMVLEQLDDDGVQEIYYSGGEPFIRKDMIAILEETRKRGILANVSTNGSFLTPELASHLRDIDVNLIHISLDSDREEEYDRFRGGEYYAKTVEAIDNAKSVGLYVRVGAVIWKDNADHLRDMIEFLMEHRVDEVVFNWLIRVGRFKENSEMGISLDEFDGLISQVRGFMREYKGRIKVSMHRSEPYIDDGSHCLAGSHLLFILPDGRVSPCSWLAKLDGQFVTEKTLKTCTLNELKHGSAFLRWNEVLDKRCRVCSSGCPAICYERTGSYYTEDPLLLHNMH